MLLTKERFSFLLLRLGTGLQPRLVLLLPLEIIPVAVSNEDNHCDHKGPKRGNKDMGTLNQKITQSKPFEYSLLWTELTILSVTWLQNLHSTEQISTTKVLSHEGPLHLLQHPPQDRYLKLF
jgi:hypothetical protein